MPNAFVRSLIFVSLESGVRRRLHASFSHIMTRDRWNECENGDWSVRHNARFVWECDIGEGSEKLDTHHRLSISPRFSPYLRCQRRAKIRFFAQFLMAQNAKVKRAEATRTPRRHIEHHHNLVSPPPPGRMNTQVSRRHFQPFLVLGESLFLDSLKAW